MIDCPSLRILVAPLLAAMLIAGCAENPESLLASAKDYLAKHDNKAAVIQLKNALQKDPNLAEARFLLGSALLEAGDPAAAENELRKALELHYPADRIAPVLARSLLSQGQFRKVVDEFAATGAAGKQGAADLQTSVGEAYSALGQLAPAQAAFAAATAADSDFLPARLAMARLKAATRDLAGAAADVDGILAKAPASAEAWYLKGMILLAQNHSNVALTSLRKAVEAKPDYLAAHDSIITLLMRQGNSAEATKQLEAMKQVAPKHPRTLYIQALVAYQNKDFSAARAASQEQLRLTPESLSGLQLAAAIEYQLRSYAQAESHLSRILQRAPGAVAARRLLILTHLRSGRPAKAMEVLEPVLDKIGADSDMLALAGEVFMANNEAERASDFYAKASRLDPGSSAKRTYLAVSHLATGDADAAFTELEKIAAAETGTRADMALIASHLRRAEYDKALAAVGALEKKLPNDPLPHNLRGSALAAKGNVAEARRSFEKALAINATYFPAAANLASLDILEKKPDEAKKRFEAVLAADPKNIQALLALADLRSRNSASHEEVVALLGRAVSANPTDTAPRLALIAYYLKAKDPKKAVAAAQDALAALPDRPEILDAAGRAQKEAGDTNQALSIYSKLATLQPGSPLPYLRSAEIQAAGKNNDAALQSLAKALEIKPDLLEAQRAIIALNLAAGRRAEALATARKVQRQRPKEAAGFLFEGDIQASGRSWDAATVAYGAGLKATGAPQLAVRLHSALEASGAAARADSFATGWLKAHPKDDGFRSHLADRATARGEYAQAAKMFHAVLEAQPNNALVLNNLAWVSARLKDPRALDYAERANQLAPDQPAIMDTLGVLLVDREVLPRGIDLLKRAVDLAPGAPTIRLNLAKALIKAKQVDAAKMHLQELAKLGGKFAAQGEVAQLLKNL